MATELTMHDAIDIGSYAIAQGILAMIDAGDTNTEIREAIFEILDLTEGSVPQKLIQEIEEQRAQHLASSLKGVLRNG